MSSTLDELLDISHLIRYEAGAQLNEIGEPCEGLSFVISGCVRVDLMDAIAWVKIAQLEPGDLFGAMEWLESKPWEERLVATERSEVLYVPSASLKLLSVSSLELQREITGTVG